MLDWDKLKVFYHVANAGSITTAAQKLNISQPALSRSIINLEARLGSKLFKRHKRGISLTRQGEILYRGAYKMYMESRNMENLLKEGADSVEGELSILTTPAIASSWLIRFIPGFYELYPKVRLKIVGELSHENLSNYDILIRPPIPSQPTLIQKHLTTFHMRLFASKKYLDLNGTPQKPEDLDHHRLITFGGDSLHPLGNINWILNVGRKVTSLREPYLQVNSAQGLLRAAELGLGIVELGKGYPAMEGVDLVEVLPEFKGPDVDAFFIYPEYKGDMKKINSFYKYLLESIGKDSEMSEYNNKNAANLIMLG